MQTEDENELIQAIKELVTKHWSESKSPILFAAIPPQIKRLLPNYQEILAGRNLSHFVRDNMFNLVKRVDHPTQRSKIGLIPHQEEYYFVDNAENDDFEISNTSKLRTQKDSVDFNLRNILDLFSRFSVLSDDEIKEINIPFHIIYKIAKK